VKPTRTKARAKAHSLTMLKVETAFWIGLLTFAAAMM